MCLESRDASADSSANAHGDAHADAHADVDQDTDSAADQNTDNQTTKHAYTDPNFDLECPGDVDVCDVALIGTGNSSTDE